MLHVNYDGSIKTNLYQWGTLGLACMVPGYGNARPVVAHLEAQPLAGAYRGDVDLGDATRPGRAVPDGILDEWLQQERRHHGRPGARLHAERHLEPVAEPRLLDRDEMIEQLELLLQGHEGTALATERMTQQLAQPRDHAIER